MSLPNSRLVITGTPRADAAFDVVEISQREAKRAGEVLERATAQLSAKMRRELSALRADLRKIKA